MPRWASRITLEVIAIRVQRLHEITDADALAEGVTIPEVVGICECRRLDIEVPGPHLPTCTWRDEDVDPDGMTRAQVEFAIAWNEINGTRLDGKASWAWSPWVWVIDFRRVT
jgi:hypothetical protein